MGTLLRNARLVLENGILKGWLLVEQGKIQSFGPGEPSPGKHQVMDLEGLFLSPGFVELHTHGAGGADFMDGTAEAYELAAMTHLAHGTTTLLPTTLAAEKEEIMESIRGFLAAREAMKGRGPNMPGLHMEGPYLNKDYCGAIDPQYIRNPEPEEYEEILTFGKNAIARWTVAVELPGMERFIRRLREENVLPSLGHSGAEYCQVKDAFEWGVTHVTHLYSAMSTIVRKGGFRHSGVQESAFCIPEMTVEVIADGCHLPSELLELVWRVKNPARMALTCDSIRCAGQNVTESIIGSLDKGQRIIIEDGVAKMPDRSCFAGSIATDDRLVRTMHKDVGIPLWEAVQMMSLTPARILGLGDRKGSIALGKDADLVCFDSDIRVLGTMVEGQGLTCIFRKENAL